MAEKSVRVDIVILTVLREEFAAVLRYLQRARSAPYVPESLNHYAWEIGEIPLHGTKQAYVVALGMLGQAGNISSALATQAALEQWRPTYLFFVGIAGGFPVDGITNGDIVISDMIYGYEYGKIDQGFHPRNNLIFSSDKALQNKAISYVDKDNSWREKLPVSADAYYPKVIKGNIASGDKVIDDPGNDFFAQVLRSFDRVHAVEMEGAGVASAIEQIKDRFFVRFLMIRGISDMPRVNHIGDVRGTQERDLWKQRATLAAAAFTVTYIAAGLPTPPGWRNYSEKRYNRSLIVVIVTLCVILIPLFTYLTANRTGALPANNQMPTALPTPTPDPALEQALHWKVIISDSFNGDSSSLPITRTVDQFADVQTSIVENRYQIRMNAFGETIAWALPHPTGVYTDFLACVDILKVAGPLDSSAAIMFRAIEIKHDETNAWFYGVRLVPDQQSYRIKGNVQNQNDFEHTDFISSHVIETHGTNRFCILATGSHFRYYINGAYVHENSGSELKAGKINLGLGIPRKGESIYQFDNLEIRAP